MTSSPPEKHPIVLMDAARIERTLRRMAFQLLESAGLQQEEQLNLIGLNERGYYLAGQMQVNMDTMLRTQTPGNVVKTSLHQLWIKPEAASVSAPPGFDAQKPFVPVLPPRLQQLLEQSGNTHQFILIDDVLFSGQSLAKAFNLLFNAVDSGRAASDSYPRIRTAILIDRGHRRFPLYPELLGMNYPTKFNEHIEAQLPPAHSAASVVLLPEYRV